MSFGLTPQRRWIAFDMTTGSTLSETADNVTCVLDIHSNLAMNMGNFGLDRFSSSGNYSVWVPLVDNEGVAVTGLTSCGAVLVANRDFSRVAAGHMSGDATFVNGWCDYLMNNRAGVRPAFMLWGTGTSGSRKTGGKVLMQYMKALKLSPSKAPAVASCGSILLARSSRGKAFASYDVRFEFRRTGQAVRTFSERNPLAELLSQFSMLQDFDNSADLTNYTMLLVTLGTYVGESVTLQFAPDKQKTLIVEQGPALMQKYAPKVAQLPADYQKAFRSFNIFKAFPALRI